MNAPRSLTPLSCTGVVSSPPRIKNRRKEARMVFSLVAATGRSLAISQASPSATQSSSLCSAGCKLPSVSSSQKCSRCEPCLRFCNELLLSVLVRESPRISEHPFTTPSSHRHPCLGRRCLRERHKRRKRALKCHIAGNFRNHRCQCLMQAGFPFNQAFSRNRHRVQVVKQRIEWLNSVRDEAAASA